MKTKVKSQEVEMKDVWIHFPHQILEYKILSHLPLASVCRFKAVCKRWKEFTTEKHFVLSHARLSQQREEYVTVTVAFGNAINSKGGWSVLDMANNKIVTIRDDFLKDYVKPKECVKYELPSIRAAHGGLFVLMYKLKVKSIFKAGLMLVVCNPVLQIAKVLPPLYQEPSDMSISVDRTSMEYEIKAINVHWEKCEGTIDIYESKIATWRRVVIRKDSSLFSGMYPRATISVNENLFYYQLQLDASERAFYKERANMHPDLDFTNLVVLKQNQLFFFVMKWAQDIESVQSICIYKILLESNEIVMLTKMPEFIMQNLVGHDLCKIDIYKIPPISVYYPVVATGCGSSIVFFSRIGRCVAYDVYTKSWDYYADTNLPKYFKNRDWYYSRVFFDYYGHCFSLCPP